MEKSSKNLIMLLGIIILVIASIFFLPKIYNPPIPLHEDQYFYNDFSFTKNQGVWSTTFEFGPNLYLVQLRNGPLELEDIPVIGSIPTFGNSYSKFYVTFNPENHDSFVTMSNAEISPGLVTHFGKDLQAACSVEDACEKLGVEYVTCDTTSEGVLYINMAEETSIEIKDNCAIISGNGDDLIRAADRFMYGLYGIMK